MSPSHCNYNLRQTRAKWGDFVLLPVLFGCCSDGDVQSSVWAEEKPLGVSYTNV